MRQKVTVDIFLCGFLFFLFIFFTYSATLKPDFFWSKIGSMDKRVFSESSNTTSGFHKEAKSLSDRAKPYPLTVYFDGECPICRREIDLMKMFNRKDHLQFIDFSNASYQSADQDLNQCDLARVIHARWSDGTIIIGVEVFREMWEAIGLGFLARFSRLSGINTLLVKAYAWFAKNRLRLTGRA